jgi:ABC-type phosphate/phosphonate transport system substrate-binding protein
VAVLEPSASAAADSNTRTIRQQVIADTVIAEHVMTLRDAEKAASGSQSNSDQKVVIVIARPEINAISDLTGKAVAMDDRYSASSNEVRTAIAAAGALEVQISEGQAKAIDRLVRGEVPAAVLTLLYPETGFPQFAGFNIFRIPLGPHAPTARL